MIVTPTCRFCQGKLKSGGSQTGGYPYTKLLYNCEPCMSQQMYKYDATPLEFSFYLNFGKRQYHIGFYPDNMRLAIHFVNTSPGPGWKPCVDIHLSEFPAWLRPDNITEERIKTLMVFS